MPKAIVFINTCLSFLFIHLFLFIKNKTKRRRFSSCPWNKILYSSMHVNYFFSLYLSKNQWTMRVDVIHETRSLLKLMLLLVLFSLSFFFTDWIIFKLLTDDNHYPFFSASSSSSQTTMRSWLSYVLFFFFSPSFFARSLSLSPLALRLIINTVFIHLL